MSGPLDVIGGSSGSGGVVSSPTAPSSPSNGTLWYNTTAGALQLWDGTTWVLIGGGAGGATVSNTAPAAPTNGMLWYDPSLSKMQVFYNGVWIATGTGSGASGTSVTVGNTSPTPPTTGALWYDTTSKVLKVYDGSSWNIPSGVIVRGVTAGADQGSVQATFNADAITVYSNEILIYTYLGAAYVYTGVAGAPVTAAAASDFTALGATVNVNTQAVVLGSQADIGLAWTALAVKPVTTGAVVTLATYNGDTYILLNEADPQQPGSWQKVGASAASTVAAAAPSGPSNGQLWFDTATNTLKVWSGTAWTAADRASVTVAGAAPATPFTGQFFLNTGVNPHVLEVWSGSAWVTVDNQPAVAASAPAVKGTGNIWLDTGVVPNVLKIWDGSAWVTPSPVISVAAVAPTLPVAGTFWLDVSTPATPLLKLRNGAAWLTINSIPAAGTGAAGRVATADAAGAVTWTAPAGISPRGIAAGTDQGSVEATFNTDAITVGARDVVIYTYGGSSYFYTGPAGAPVTGATAAQFTKLSSTAVIDSQFVALATAADIGAAWTAYTPKPTVGGATMTIATFQGGAYILTNEAAPGTAASWTLVSPADLWTGIGSDIYRNSKVRIGSAVTPAAMLDITGGTQTASVPVLNMAQTWNALAATFNAIRLNIVNTASAIASKLIDLQIGGVSVFNVSVNKRVGVNVANAAGTVEIASGTITALEPVLKMSQTWNAPGVVHRAVQLDVTNTASGTASELINVTYDTRSVFGVFAADVGTLFEVVNKSSQVVFEVTDLGVSTIKPTGVTTNSVWRLGDVQTPGSPVAVSTTQFVQVEINGALVKLAVVS